MPKRVLVVLGAGASHDLIPYAGGKRFAPADDRFHPPLTQAIFEDSELTEETLKLYPGARTLAFPIRVALHNDEPLEPLLKQLADAQDNPRAQQFPEIPLYLQDLFGKISANFTDQPFNYAYLADKLFAAESGFERIAFVMLNYDTLLEKVLDPYYLGAPIANMDSYIMQRCLLVKLHGSVNWARSLVIPRGTFATIEAGGLEQYLAVIQHFGNVDLPRVLSKEIRLQDPAERWTTFGEVYYPAVSVPLGEYEPVCPYQHIEALQEFLSTCRNVLIVGVSGRDNDLLTLLHEHLPERVHTLVIVDANQDSAEAARDNFRREVPQLRIEVEPLDLRQLQTNGFSNFILSGSLDRFVAVCE